MQQGSGYLGSSETKLSSANEEVIPQPPEGWTLGYFLYKFSFYNQQDVRIKINNGSQIFLSAGQGFSMDQNDCKIESFVIVDENVNYNWIGAY